jgi:hypothetical protein
MILLEALLVQLLRFNVKEAMLLRWLKDIIKSLGWQSLSRIKRSKHVYNDEHQIFL